MTLVAEFNHLKEKHPEFSDNQISRLMQKNRGVYKKENYKEIDEKVNQNALSSMKYLENANRSLFKMDELVCAIKENIKSGKKGVKEVYGKVDFTPFLRKRINKETGQFSCAFFKQDGGSPFVAWTHTNNKGITRYYSKGIKDGKERRYRLDLVDLLALSTPSIREKAFHEEVREKEQRLYRYPDGNWATETRQYTLVHYTKSKAIEGVKNHYPYASLLVKEHERLNNNVRYVYDSADVYEWMPYEVAKAYETFIEYAKRKMNEKVYEMYGETIVFGSLEYISDIHQEIHGERITKASLSYALNYLSSLRLLTKVSNKNIINSSISYSEKKNRNEITYVSFPTVDVDMYWANRHGEKFLKKNVPYSKVTYRNVKRVLGPEKINEVYPNKVVAKKQSKNKKERQEYQQMFYSLLRKNGYVLKNELSGIVSPSIANKLWRQLTNETRGYSARMSNTIREKYEIVGTGAVFVSTSVVHPFIPLHEEKELRKEEVFRKELIYWEEIELIDVKKAKDKQPDYLGQRSTDNPALWILEEVLANEEMWNGQNQRT